MQACGLSGSIANVIVQSDGLDWLVDDGVDSGDRIGPHHEEELTPLVLDLLPEGGILLDVGAHVGHYALRAAAKASRVIAVEPNPDTVARLKENLAANSITNVDCVPVAAWDGVARFRVEKVHQSYERDGSNRIVPDAYGPIWGARLDDALNQYPLRPERLDLVKVDVEGADLQALSGMAGLLARHRPVLFVEDHAQYGYYQQGELFKTLDDLGYTSREEVTWGSSTYWVCRPAASSASTGSQWFDSTDSTS